MSRQLRANSPAVRNMRRRLERWELPHLRQLAASQNELIEQLQAELEHTQQRLTDAELHADIWHDRAIDMMNSLVDENPEHRCIGLTKDGALMVVNTSHAHQCAPAFDGAFGTHVVMAA